MNKCKISNRLLLVALMAGGLGLGVRGQAFLPGKVMEYHWDRSGSAWDSTRQIVYGYAPGGLVSDAMYYDHLSGPWGPSTHLTRSYDGAGLLVEELMERWNRDSLAWQDVQWDINAYDGLGNQTLEFNRSWMSTTQTWRVQDSTETIWAYDAQQRVVVREVLQHRFGAWYRYTYGYDGEGRKVEQEYLAGSLGGNLVPQYRKRWVYDVDGRLLSSYEDSWRNGGWQDSLRVVNSWNTDGELASYMKSTRESGEWVDYQYHTFTWEDYEAGRVSTHERYFVYGDTAQYLVEWEQFLYGVGEEIRLYTETYQAQGPVYRQTRQWDAKERKTLDRLERSDSLGWELRSEEQWYFYEDGNEMLVAEENHRYLAQLGAIFPMTRLEYADHITSRGVAADVPTVALWPNPSSGTVQLAGPELRAGMPVSVFDLSGKQCWQGNLQGNGPHVLELGHLVPGMYLLRCGGLPGTRLQVR